MAAAAPALSAFAGVCVRNNTAMTAAAVTAAPRATRLTFLPITPGSQPASPPKEGGRLQLGPSHDPGPIGRIREELIQHGGEAKQPCI